MSNFAVWKDVVYTANVQDLRYYVKADGETIYQGRAKADPSGTVRINVREIVKDWLDSNIRDYLPMSPDFVAHPEALRVCGLYDAETDVLLAEYNVLFNFDTDWNGEDLLLQNPVNTHADPRQKIFAGYGTIDPDGADVDITVRDLYWFNADDLVNVLWNAGEANVPVNTNYPLNLISVVVPAGVRLKKMHQTYFEFEVPVNFLNASQSYYVQYWKGGVMIDQTEIKVGACTAYFNCPNSITVSGDGTYFDIAFTTDIPLEYIGVEPGSGIRLVNLYDGRVRLYAEPNTSLNPFNTGVRFINTETGNQVGYTYVTVSAPTVYFFVDPVYYMDCDGGTLTIPVTTSYDMSQVAVQTPGAVTVLSKTQNGITVRVDANTSTTDVAIHNIVFKYGSRVLGSTRIEVDTFAYHFSTIDSIGYNPYDDENVFIPWTTNIPIDAIAITLPPGSTLVSRDASGITITHPSADGNVTFSFNGGTLAIVPVYSYAEDYLTIHATSDGYLPWDSNAEIRINGGSWETLNPDSNHCQLIHNGDTVEMRATTRPEHSGYPNPCNYPLPSFNVSGNVLSVLFGDNYATATSYNGKTLYQFFAGVRVHVKDASKLVMPSFSSANCCKGMFNNSWLEVAPPLPYIDTLATGAYSAMFGGCTNLRHAPSPNARVIGESSCASMYYHCTSLTSAGDITAVQVGTNGCSEMFYQCTSLATAPAISATTLGVSAFTDMFYGCSSLVTVQPSLPATSLPASAYWGMFRDCTSLGTAPEIKAVTVGDSSMGSMFSGCTNLTNVPDLVTTNLGYNAMSQMFQNCTSLVNAPVLPATVGAGDCYRDMFHNCTSLRYIKCLLSDTGSSYRDFTYGWVDGVPFNVGTFVKQTGVYFTGGVDGIPAGWTVQEV